MRDNSLFLKGLTELNIELDAHQLEQFEKYYDLLTEWNQVMNLTAITEWEEVIVKHFIDSLSLVKIVTNMTQVSYSLIDVGTGAGFPGIPLKIAFPKLKVTLLDSLNKRVTFLNEVINRLGLDDITAVHGRAEDFGRNSSYRESFDIVVSRAVSNMAVLSELCIPFVKVGGRFIPYKSEKKDEEYESSLHAVSVLGGSYSSSSEFTLPCSEYYRILYSIRKDKPTPNKYPRKAGTPAKSPIN